MIYGYEWEIKKHSFRHSAGFGKRMEFAIFAEIAN